MQFLMRVNRVIRRTIKKTWRLQQFKRRGIKYVPPNFIFFPDLTPSSTVIDAGCGYEADFSVAMIEGYGAKAIAVDPTLKHRPALKKLTEKYKGRFEHLPFAISISNGTLNFHEPKTYESGSIFSDHGNMKRDDFSIYEVTAINLKSLLDHIDIDQIDILKLDIEGAEYEFLEEIARDDLLAFKQLFIEFHHHAVKRYTQTDTRRLTEKVCGYGFESYSLDDHNYLFSRVGRQGIHNFSQNA